MVKFNPDVPQIGAPNYIGLSHPITQPEADKSLGVALSGIGDIFQSAAKAGYTTINEMAGEEARRKIEPLQQNMIDTLRQGKSMQAVTQMQGATTNPSTADNSDPLKAFAQADEGIDDRTLPDDVGQGFDRADRLVAGRANGKVSTTEYYSQLDNIARSLRNRYPGFKDEIDQHISNLTGVKPANALMRSLIADINAKETGTNYERNQAVKLATQKNYEALFTPQEMQSIIAGAPGFGSGFVMQRIGPKAKADLDYTTNKQRLEMLEGQEKLNEKDATEFINRTVQDSANVYVNNIPEPPPVDASEEEQQKWALSIGKARKDAEQDAIGKITDSPAGKYAKNLTDQVKNNLAVFDSIDRAAFDDKRGTVMFNKRLVEAMKTDTYKQMFSDKDMGKWNRLLEYVKTNTPDAYRTWFEAMMKEGSTFNQDIGKYMARLKQLEVLAQDPNKPQTLQNIFEQSRRSKANNYDQLLSWAGQYTDPKTDLTTKLQLGRTIYSPNQRGFVNSMSDDYWDRAGVYHLGKYGVFRNLATDEAAQTSFNLGKRNPEIWENYKEYVGGTARELFHQDVLNLNNIQTSRNMGIRWATTEDGHHRFHLVVKDGGKILDDSAELSNRTYLSTGERAYLIEPNALKTARESINKLNKGIDALSGIAKVTPGADVGTFVLRTLKDYGLDIRNPENIPGLPGDMVRSIIQEREQEQKKEEKAKSKRTPE